MATLEKIRNKAGLLVIVVGLALFAFIIGDFLRSGSTFFRQNKENVVAVDGESVSIHEFQRKVEELTEVYKMQSGATAVPEEIQSQIRETVFENIVRQIIVGEESKKVGLTVCKAELSDLVMGDNISPMIMQMPMFVNEQTGQFDKAKLIQFLQTIESDDLSNQPEEARTQILAAKKFWLFWEQNIKEQRLETKYNTLVAKAVNANTLDAKANYENNKVTADFEYVVQNYMTIPDDQVTVTTDEIQKRYNEQKEQFKQDAGQQISYITVNIAPSDADYAKFNKIISDLKPEFSESSNVADVVNDNSDVPYANIYVSLPEVSNQSMKDFVQNANIGDVEGPALVASAYHLYKLVDRVTAPDSIKINQLSLPASMPEADLKAFGDSIVGVIKGGKPFSEVAMELTGGRFNGELGWVTESILLQQSSKDEKFVHDAFNAPTNDVFIIKTDLGAHIVQVTEKTASVAKYKIANIQMAVTPSPETYNKLYNDLSQYITKNSTLDKFESEAQGSGYTIQKEVRLAPNMPTLNSYKGTRQIIRWAFEHKKGDISEIFDCQDKFIVAGVEDSFEEGYRSLNAISDMLKREIMDDKKAEKIITDLKAKNFSTLDQYSETMGSPVQSVKFVSFATERITGIGVEPILNVKAPIAEVGKISEPLKGRVGVFVVKVTNKQTNPEKYDQQAQQKIYSDMNSYRVMSQAIPVLRFKAKVDDHRIRFY